MEGCCGILKLFRQYELIDTEFVEIRNALQGVEDERRVGSDDAMMLFCGA